MAGTGDFEDYPVVRVFTFKEGLLSRFAHDLQMALTEFHLEFSEGKLSGVFQTRAIVVEGAIREGKLDPKLLSAGDCKKILKNVRTEVLLSDRYPDARFEASVSSDDDGIRLDGALTLIGRRVAIPTVRPVHVGNAWIAELHLTPSRWGIKPYRAMGGALKIQDRIKVEVALPAAEDIDSDDGTKRWEMKAPTGSMTG